jgi:hypothetical protein
MTTFLLIAVSPFGFGSSSRSGLVSPVCTLRNGGFIYQGLVVAFGGGVFPISQAPCLHSLLVIWELWNKRNARVFLNKFSPSFVVFENIKREVWLWVLARAKRLSDLMSEE